MFESTPMVVYTLFYIIVSVCFVMRTTEFVSNGLTVEGLFERFMEKEHNNFVMHHIKRTAFTLYLHSLLPVVYILGTLLVNDDPNAFVSVKFYELLTLMLLPVVMTTWIVSIWSLNNWGGHPIALALSRFNTSDWTEVARSLSAEYQRPTKLTLACGTMSRTIVTETWVMSIRSYMVAISKKTESSFVVYSSDNHDMTPEGTFESVQFVNIHVIPIRSRIKWFNIRIKSEDFKTLEESIGQSIQIAGDIKLQRSRTERFMEVFREQVSQNPVYKGYTVVESEDNVCAGCLVNPPNVKLTKCCQGNHDNEIMQCNSCQCRPMWCVDCMAKWYESRQSQMNTTSWLSSKCTCPLCRQVFCILDVCPLENSDLAKAK